MLNDRQLKELVNTGRQAKDLADNGFFADLIEGLVESAHRDVVDPSILDLAADENGNKAKLAILAYRQALFLRDTITDQVERGKQAEEALERT